MPAPNAEATMTSARRGRLSWVVVVVVRVARLPKGPKPNQFMVFTVNIYGKIIWYTQ